MDLLSLDSTVYLFREFGSESPLLIWYYYYIKSVDIILHIKILFIEIQRPVYVSISFVIKYANTKKQKLLQSLDLSFFTYPQE